VRRNIRVNLRFAAGWLHPVVAALLMVGSSAFVSFNALRGPVAESPDPKSSPPGPCLPAA
jgi:hypothetical protein